MLSKANASLVMDQKINSSNNFSNNSNNHNSSSSSHSWAATCSTSRKCLIMDFNSSSNNLRDKFSKCIPTRSSSSLLREHRLDKVSNLIGATSWTNTSTATR